MPINGFDFPGTVFSQEFENSTTGTQRTLGVACIGRQYQLHEAGGANAVKLNQTATKYATGTALSFPLTSSKVSANNTIDPIDSTHRLVIKNGVWSYDTISAAATFDPDTFKVTLSGGVTVNGRTIQVGDPVILIGNGTDSPFLTTVLKVDETAKSITIDPTDLTALGTFSSIKLCVYQDATLGSADSAFSFTSDKGAEAISVNADVTTELSAFAGLQDNIVTGLLEGGDFYVEFRECVNTYNSTLGTIASLSDIKTVLGEPCAENPLALACEFAFKGSNYGVVYFMTVSDDTKAEYERVLDFLGKYKMIYSIVPCSTNVSVIKACMSDAISISENKESQLRRKVWYGIDPVAAPVLWEGKGVYTARVLPSITVSSTVYTRDADSDADGAYAWKNGTTVKYTASAAPTTSVKAYADSGVGTGTDTSGTDISAVTEAADGTIVLVGNPFIKYTVKSGDCIEFVAAGVRYPITSDNGTNTVTGISDLIAGVNGSASQLDVRLVRTVPEPGDIAQDLINQRIARTNSERGICVWADNPIYNSESIPSFAVAAAAAGMRAAEYCHRPVSNLGYSFFSLAESNMTASMLQLIGSNGIWIVANNEDGLPVNKRQVTTAVANNINKDEESIIANMDTVALSVGSTGSEYTGNSNISPEMVDRLEDELKLKLDDFLVNKSGSVFIGPQLLEYEIISIYQDPVSLDHIYADFSCTPPKPFNKFYITMRIL